MLFSQIKRQPFNSDNTAREKLLQSAIRFFGERGGNVPMLEISTAAGQKNKSAVTYHFKSKDGLIDAVYDSVLEYLEPRYEILINRLESSIPPPDIYEIGLSLNAPFFSLYSSEPDGNYAIKALARLIHDSPPAEESRYRSFLEITFARFANIVSKNYPENPKGQIIQHLMHYLLATSTGLAATDRWRDLDFRSDEDLMFELFLSYTDYVAGGLGASVANRPAIDEEFWRKVIAS